MRLEQETVAQKGRTGRSTRNGGAGPGGPATPHRQLDDLLTERSGRPGGTPLGRVTRIEPDEDADVRRSLTLENAGAATLAAQGYHLRQNPTKAEVAQARLDTGDVGDPRKDPDYLLEGRVFDCYSPIKPHKAVRGIWKQAQEKVEEGQTQRVVVNLEDWRGDLSALEKQFADWPIPGLKEVKAITRDGDVVQIDLPPHRPMEVYPWLSNTD
ncbi:hypothetical protein [Actinoplanes sp. M2I2]|uniref:CdiA C-terminal domain-containing protein n=1 Tax=Actinoplanes sp. M2I2 TaxID=1734444 RepID=UPI0035B08F6D